MAPRKGLARVVAATVGPDYVFCVYTDVCQPVAGTVGASIITCILVQSSLYTALVPNTSNSPQTGTGTIVIRPLHYSELSSA